MPKSSIRGMFVSSWFHLVFVEVPAVQRQTYRLAFEMSWIQFSMRTRSTVFEAQNLKKRNPKKALHSIALFKKLFKKITEKPKILNYTSVPTRINEITERTSCERKPFFFFTESRSKKISCLDFGVDELVNCSDILYR
jgi:hypothetical protein